MDTALLSGTDTDSLSVLDIADGVALGIFQCDKCYLEVTECLRSELFVLCRYILEELRIVEIYLVATLLECNTEYLLVLDWVRAVVRVNLYNAVVAFLLFLEYLKGFRLIVRGNNSIADLTLDEACCRHIYLVAECAEVTIRAHTVGTTGAGVGICKG